MATRRSPTDLSPPACATAPVIRSRPGRPSWKHCGANCRNTAASSSRPRTSWAPFRIALGFSYSGNLAVTGSAGPGISLKTEAIGWASMAEIPLIIINVQRGGPSTGLPTNVEQSDLHQAIYRRTRRQPARRSRRSHSGRLFLHRGRSGAHRPQIQHAGFHPQRHLARHPDRGLRRAEALRAHARPEAGPDHGREPQALCSRPDHASRATRDADSRRQIPAHQRPRARRDGAIPPAARNCTWP